MGPQAGLGRLGAARGWRTGGVSPRWVMSSDPSGACISQGDSGPQC